MNKLSLVSRFRRDNWLRFFLYLFGVRRQLEDGPDYRPLLKQIQSSGESHIILDVSPEKIVSLLRQASEVKMMEEYQSYIITSLDAHTLDFEELKYMRANITTLRLIDPTSFEVMNGMWSSNNHRSWYRRLKNF